MPPTLQAGFTRKSHFDDAFTLNRVVDDTVSHVNFVAGMVPIVRQFIQDHQEKRGAVPITQVKQYALALRDFYEFFYVGGTPQKDRQKLLRDLKVTDLPC